MYKTYVFVLITCTDRC